MYAFRFDIKEDRGTYFINSIQPMHDRLELDRHLIKNVPAVWFSQNIDFIKYWFSICSNVPKFAWLLNKCLYFPDVCSVSSIYKKIEWLIKMK